MKEKRARTRSIPALTQSGQAHLAALGENVLIAIKRRKLRRKDVAQQALISEPTLRAVLRGDPTVSIGCYLAVLAALGLDHGLREVADPKQDEVGIALSLRNLPARVKPERSKYDF